MMQRPPGSFWPASHEVPMLSARSFSFLVLLAAPVAAAQGFTTGPTTEPARRVSPDEVPLLPSADSPWGGTDIQANPVITGAQNETSFAVSPTDPLNWVGVANDYRTGTVETGWYSTQDGGQTWSSGTFGVLPGFSFSGDPCVTADQDGNFVIAGMMYLGAGGGGSVLAWRSTDKGQTWSAPIEIDFDGDNDKPQIECDLSSSPFANRIAVAWDRFGSPDDVHVSVSSDGGLTWTPEQKINDPISTTAIGPDVCWGPSGELYVMWADRAFGNERIFVDKSTDGGLTWGTDVLVTPYNPVPSTLPGNFLRMFSVFAMHADQSSGPYSGNVYIAFHQWLGGTGNNRSDVVVGDLDRRGCDLELHEGHERRRGQRPDHARALRRPEGQRQRDVLRPAARPRRQPALDVGLALVRRRGHVDGLPGLGHRLE